MPSAPPPKLCQQQQSISLSIYRIKDMDRGRANAKRAQRAGTSKHIMTINYKTYNCKIKTSQYRTTNYKCKITIHKHSTINYKDRMPTYKLRITTYKKKTSTYECRTTTTCERKNNNLLSLALALSLSLSLSRLSLSFFGPKFQGQGQGGPIKKINRTIDHMSPNILIYYYSRPPPTCKCRMTNYECRITTYKRRTTTYEYRMPTYKRRITTYK